MAQLVAQHAAHFIVGHHVHQAAVDAHAAVGHGPGVDVLGHVDLGVQRQAGVLQAAHHGGEPLGVRAVRRGERVLLVHLGAGLVGELLDAHVGERGGGEQAAAGLRQAVHVGAGTAGEQQRAAKGRAGRSGGGGEAVHSLP
ncbi:hypothetical protein D3C86_1715390 [compost metagenome]